MCLDVLLVVSALNGLHVLYCLLCFSKFNGVDSVAVVTGAVVVEEIHLFDAVVAAD